jgi:hypothetical protein
MFGVLRPQQQSFRYRRLYARLCQHYRGNYGLRAGFWLNYETLFLYAIAFDLGLLPTAAIKDQWCCRLRRDPTLPSSSDHQLGSLLAAVGLLAGSLKVEDDLRDKSGLAPRLIHVMFHKLFGRARKNLADRDVNLPGKLTAVMAAQNAVEAQKVPTAAGSESLRASLEKLCQPTVSGFITIFDLFARQLDLPTGSPLTRLAAPIARAIVSFDQAIDFERDKQGKGHTVLSDEGDRLAALDHAHRQVKEARSISLVWLGPDSLASEILHGFQHRIESTIMALQSPRASQSWYSRSRTLRTLYWTLLGVVMPTTAMAADSDDDCSHKCCCFCLGYICGEGSSQARR